MAKPPRFHTKPLRRRRSRKRGWLTSLAIFAAAIAAVFLIGRLPIISADWQQTDMRFTLCEARSSDACVIDGDTILIGRRKIRLTGYNAPELAGECPAESALARTSRDALLTWLNTGPFQMDGGSEPPRDQYGRELRAAKRGNTWLSDDMIEAELAQESGWGTVRGGWC